MKKHHKEYIEYEKERDVLFVFGAGASIADGGPLQRDLLPNIFKLNEEESQIVKIVKEFLLNNFHITNDNYPSLESVFGYLDLNYYTLFIFVFQSIVFQCGISGSSPLIKSIKSLTE